MGNPVLPVLADYARTILQNSIADPLARGSGLLSMIVSRWAGKEDPAGYGKAAEEEARNLYGYRPKYPETVDALGLMEKTAIGQLSKMPELIQQRTEQINPELGYGGRQIAELAPYFMGIINPFKRKPKINMPEKPLLPIGESKAIIDYMPSKKGPGTPTETSHVVKPEGGNPTFTRSEQLKPLNLSGQQRRKTSPYASEDIPLSEWITRYRGNSSLMSKPQTPQTVEEFKNWDFSVPEGGASTTPKKVFSWKREEYETLHDLATQGDEYRFKEALGKGWSDWKPSLHLAEKVKRNEPITIYRVSEEGPIIPGAYVSESLEYVKQHQKNIMQGKGKIYSIQVKPSELMTYGDPHEFIYIPESAEKGFQLYQAQTRRH